MSRLLIGCSFLLGCVEIRDESGLLPKDDTVVGQFDTGFQNDTSLPDLPETIACAHDAACVEWLGGAACLAARCEAGACMASPLPDGVPCSDGDPSTQGDRCERGTCTPGTAVCLCAENIDCIPFDDGDGCNGGLACDGCACYATETPEGTPCDDGLAATVDDRCDAQARCAGEVPCACEANTDCAAAPCAVAACGECTCRSYGDAPGTAYATFSFLGAFPAGFEVVSDNPLTTWRATADGVSASGTDGTYDHGPVVTTLTGPVVPLPDGPVGVEVRFRLGAAECDDKLELSLGDTGLTICEPTALGVRSFVALGGAPLRFVARFVADADNNLGAGPLIESVRLVRLGASACGPPDSELAVTGPGATERSPDVARLGSGKWFVALADEAGVAVREVDLNGAPIGEVQREGAGDTPALSASHLAVAMEGSVLVRPFPADSADQTLSVEGSVPDLDGGFLAVTRGETGHLLALGTDLATSAEPVVSAPSLFPARAADLGGLGHLVVSEADAVSLVTVSTSIPLAGDAPVGRPDAAVAFARVGAAWPTVAGIAVAVSTGQSAVMAATAPEDVAIGAAASGWVVLWVEGPALKGRQLTGTLNLDLAIDPVSSYLFGGQRAPRLAPSGERALAVWVSPWLDGDAQTVAARRLPDPFLSP